MQQFVAGRPFFGTFIKEALRALRGRILNCSRNVEPINERLAMAFYERRSAADNKKAREDIVESNSIPYKKMFQSDLEPLPVGA
jgi:hypothetical protein